MDAHLKNFEVVSADIRVKINGSESVSEATVKLNIGKKQMHVVNDKGNGPINALDKALREALEGLFPCLKDTQLTDYEVGITGDELGTSARVRVFIIFSDGKERWITSSMSTNIIDASLQALAEGLDIAISHSSTLVENNLETS